MKKMTTRFATALLLGVLCAAPAFAKTKSRLLTVGQDFVVGATTVKAGTYVFKLDEATNELTVLNKKTKEVIARAEARVDKSKKGTFPALGLEGESAPLSFAGLSFDGKQVITTSAATAQGQ